MKFTTPYHYNLINDTTRVVGFYTAINDYINYKTPEIAKNDIVLDLGCGSGILTSFIAPYVNKVIAVDIDSKIAECAFKNFKEYNLNNVNVISEDASTFDFDGNFSNNESNKFQVDLIICEMLDTALIDEEQVQVLNNCLKYLNSNGMVIPKGIINIAEAVNTNINNIAYDENNLNIEVLSNSITINTVDFMANINKNVNVELNLKSSSNGVVNGIKITTIALLNNDLICGPSPMFNPPLIIPINDDFEIDVNKGDNLNFILSYIMGEGLETVNLTYCGTN